MKLLRLLDKVITITLISILISMCSFGIIMILTKHYIDQTLNGQELWLCMLLAAGLTFMCDLEEELKKRGNKSPQN